MTRPCATCETPFEVGKSQTRRTCSPACYRIWRNELARVAYYTRQDRVPQPKTPKLDPAFGHWFAGFTDGEGCFMTHSVTVKGVTYYAAKFIITLRRDDMATLEEIHRQLGMGHLYLKKTNNKIAGAKPQASFEIANAHDLHRLVEIFEHFPLRAKKRQDFDTWKQFIVLHKYRSNATNGALKELHDRLRLGRQYVI